MNTPMTNQPEPSRQQHMIVPKTIVIYRSSLHGFGFTLRHFIVYPPDTPGTSSAMAEILDFTQPMDTVFVKEVRPRGPAHLAGLCPGDRLLSVNGLSVAGTPYNTVVKTIQMAPTAIKLVVVPKECDTLQTFFSESAHNPETNQRPRVSSSLISSNDIAKPFYIPQREMVRCAVQPAHAKPMSNVTSTDTLHRNSLSESIYSEPYTTFSRPIETSTLSRLDHRRSEIASSSAYATLGSRCAQSFADMTGAPRAMSLTSNTLPMVKSITSNGQHSSAVQLSSNASSMPIANRFEKIGASIALPYSYESNTVRARDRLKVVERCDSFDVNMIRTKTNETNRVASRRNETERELRTQSLEIVENAKPQQRQPMVLSAMPSVSIRGNDTITVNDEQNTQASKNIAETAPSEVVLRLKKRSTLTVADRHVRRISYLKATSNDSTVHEETIEEKTEITEDTLSQLESFLRSNECLIDESIDVSFSGELNFKVLCVDGQRLSVRPWYKLSAKIRANIFEFTINGVENEASNASENCNLSGAIDLKEFHVSKVSYTKRKNVLKLSNKSKTPTENVSKKSEFLVQSENEYDLWKCSLQIASGQTSIADEKKPLTISLQPEVSGSGGISSPTSVASSSLDSGTQLSKSRTWKSLVAHLGIRRPSQSLPHNLPTLAHPPEGASIGVALASCPTSKKNKLIPLIIERCTEMVEERGLQVVGIYRIPGNTAAITSLTEQVNRGFDEQCLNDPKWEDVNVVSSLLKLFLRKLPEALLPNNMYKSFIDADKERGKTRLILLKTLIDNLPLQSYETLKHLMRHLNLISRNCDTNLMEPKNLAIIFGPSVVRTSDETLEMVVKDMKHQCHIIEAFVSNYDFFFEGGEMPAITESVLAESVQQTAEAKLQTDLLLDNVQKIEPSKEQLEKSRFVFKLVHAARNRKPKKKASDRKSTISSMTSDTLSMDSSSTSAEFKDGSDSKTSNIAEDFVLQSSLSADDSGDIFYEDNSSMSLATLIPALEGKIQLIRNTFGSSDLPLDSDGESNPSTSHLRRNLRLDSLQPISLGCENIPYADESPDQAQIPSTNFRTQGDTINDQMQNKLIGSCSGGNGDLYVNKMRNRDDIDGKSLISNSSADSDESNTSDLPENQTVRISRGMLREMNRILTTLERKATKLNRSLSLNIKYHNNECCSNNVLNSSSNQSICRLNTNTNHLAAITVNQQNPSLTKDEKTDKNINKKRQIQDNNKYRRQINRPIKRRHTVGGIHYFSHTKSNLITGKQNQVDPMNNKISNSNNDNNENNNNENNRNNYLH